MSERQSALNDLYAAYRNAGDDDMNARLRVMDDAEELTGTAASEAEVELARAHFGDVEDLEDLLS